VRDFPNSLVARIEYSDTNLVGEGIRICATGGRDFDDLGFVWSHLDVLHHFRTIREIGIGCAQGVDALVLAWAKANKVPWTRYVADWDRLGTAAGALRNGVMLEDFQPDLLMVYPGGVGTTDCARKARKMKIEREFYNLDDGSDPFVEATKWG
jgi:hypothetical protein